MRNPIPLLIILALFHAQALADDTAAFHVPDGFRVSIYAGDDLAHDIYSMTVNARGQVVVAGPGYVKTLHDDDGDGRADRATLFSKEPATGARGLFFDGHDLICTGDNALARYRDADGDGVADGPREVLAAVAVESDHSANGVVQGPDGWFYVACGNDAGVTSKHTQPGSPVAKPRQGVVLRVSPDGKQTEVVADGFRNPYDLGFAADGSLLLVDADGERDQYLPWYSPTRLFDVATGRHHGWMLDGWIRSWNRPSWFFDNVPRVVEIGRGSPTGAVVYRHRQFPDRYRNAVFSACWSLGRIYCFPLEEDGPSVSSKMEIFLQPTGSAGFAPVDLAVGPTGEMYVAIGGRGTRGGVYRIEYGSFDRVPTGPRAGAAELNDVLAADQPLASWSRARWMPSARKLGPAAFAQAVLDDRLPDPQRIRAIEILTELFGGVSDETASEIMRGGNAVLKARLAWSIGRTSPLALPDRNRRLAQLTHEADVRVQRSAWEALLDLPAMDDDALNKANWSAAFELNPPRVRAATIAVAARMDSWGELPACRERLRKPDTFTYATLTLLRRKVQRDELTHADFAAALDALSAVNSPALRLEAVRLMQLCLGDVRVEPTEPDVYAGYQPQKPLPADHPLLDRAVATLIGILDECGTGAPAGAPARPRDPDGQECPSYLVRETARLLGMLGRGQGELPAKLAALWTEASTVEDDIHYFIVLSRLPGDRSADVTRRTAAALARLQHKMRRGGMHSSRFWPARVSETFGKLLDRDPALARALVAEPLFGLPEHGLFAGRMDEVHRRQATERIIGNLADADQWTTELVRLTASLPPEKRRSLLHELWESPSLRDAIATELAKQPHVDDRPLLLQTLEFGEPRTVRMAADALLKLAAKPTPADMAAAVSAMRQFSRDKQYDDANAALDRLLAAWTSQQASPRSVAVDQRYQRWSTWLTETHPDLAKKLQSPSADFASWSKRLSGIAWDQGDAARGKKAFERRSCARCHTGHSRLGPDLAGIGRRFSRDDLFTAIVDPSRDVSPAYRVTQIETTSGKLISGQVLYESPESMLFQTDPETTVRIRQDEIATIRKSPLSPMPVGLLREATDEELADLYAWLQSMGNAK
jgi:putative membrane-bound dehydrogenase-like protein